MPVQYIYTLLLIFVKIFIENRFFFIHYILVVLSLPQLLQDHSYFPTYPNPHLFSFITVEYK